MIALDAVDLGLVHALQVDARAPFSRIASVLGVSTQTVTRRYRRLRAEASLRVVGLADPHRAAGEQWLVRLTASPHTAQDLAHALARRADTSWVKLCSGGTEIFGIVHAAAADGHTLLLHDIPRTASITAVSAHYLLHSYVGGPAAWRGRPAVLSEEQQRELAPAEAPRSTASLSESDSALLVALGEDGRASHTDLAAATGWSTATVARRLTELRSSGAIFYDIDLRAAVLGVTTQALLWMSVAPAHLDAVATALAGHAELAFVAATTGPSNLVAKALCADPRALHRYLTRRLGAFEEIRALETAPVLRTLKSAAPLTR
ncbi:Lrp/AsnC family transcriptional regulator [Amycolatopsis minnesotensis]|uniref:AsnC family transcriptional regulator n=1 Tax=Amycolatopsis minnesotensis TaxID=337894 RepID=A0ABN2QPY6_9PSEU